MTTPALKENMVAEDQVKSMDKFPLFEIILKKYLAQVIYDGNNSQEADK